MSYGSSNFNTDPDSTFKSRNRSRRAQHRRHEEAHHQQHNHNHNHQHRNPTPSSKDHSASQSRTQPHTHSHSKPKGTSRASKLESGSLKKSKTTSCATSSSLASSASGHFHSHPTSSLPTSKSRNVEYSANSSAAGWELRPHIPLVLALTSCGIIILLLIAGLTFVMLWRRRTAKLEKKRLSRERRVREDGRREGLEMRLEGLGIELEGVNDYSNFLGDRPLLSFEGRDKDGNLVEGIAIQDPPSSDDVVNAGWKESNASNSPFSFERRPTPMLNESGNQDGLSGSTPISSPKAAFISSVHHHQSKNNGGSAWRTLIPRKGKGGNDLQGTIEQYNYTPEITIEGSGGTGRGMWSSFGAEKNQVGDGFGLGIGMASTPKGSPIFADGWGGFVKRSGSPLLGPSSSSNQQPNRQPGGSNLSSITVHQHERFGKAYDEMDLALDLAPAYSDAYRAAAPKRFLQSPSQVDSKDSTSRIGRFSFGFGTTMAAGVDLTRKLSKKLDVRRSMKFFSNPNSNSNPDSKSNPDGITNHGHFRLNIPGPTTYLLNDTPALGESEFITAPLASPGMSNPFDSAFARPISPSDLKRSASPSNQAHLRPTLDRFDSAASTLVPSRASQPSSSLGRKQSSRTTVIDEQEERDQEVEGDGNENENGDGDGDGDGLNPRLSSSTIEKGLLWKTLPGGALRDGEPLEVAREDQLMAISASSSEASLGLGRSANQRQSSTAQGSCRDREDDDSPTDPRQDAAFQRIRGLRNEGPSEEIIIFTGKPKATSGFSNSEASSPSIGLGISVDKVDHQSSEDVVERVYRSVQQLVREGLGTPRKRARAASDARSIKFSVDTSSMDPDYSIGAITIRSRSATIDSTRSCHYQKGRKRSGTGDSIHSTMTRSRANSEGRRRTLVTDEIDRFYPGAKISCQKRSRKSSGASSLAVPSRSSVGKNRPLSSGSTASVWSKESRPSSYVPQFNREESGDFILPPPVPEKDSNPPQSEASAALKNFFGSPSQGKSQKTDGSFLANTSSSASQSKILSSRESPKVFTSPTFSFTKSSLPAFPSSATVSPRIHYPQPKPNSKGPVHPVELQMRLEDAREEILSNGKGGGTFYSSSTFHTPVLASYGKVPPSSASQGNTKCKSTMRSNSGEEDRTLVQTSSAQRQASVSRPEEHDVSHRGSSSADNWSLFAGDESIAGREIPDGASVSNSVRMSSAFDPRRSGSFVTKTTTRQRSSHASQTPVLTVTEAFEPVSNSSSVKEGSSISSLYSNSETFDSSNQVKLSSSSASPKSPSTLHRSRTTSGDSRRSRENSSADQVTKSPRTRPRGATIPAPRAALRGARAAAAAAASAILGDSGSHSDVKVESPRIQSPRVAFAPLDLDTRPSSRPSSPRVAFADEADVSSSIPSSASTSPQGKKSISKFESPICSSPLRKSGAIASTSSYSERKEFKNKGLKSMSTSKRRNPSNLRIDTNASKRIEPSPRSNSNGFDTSEETVTPILAGGGGVASDNSDSHEDESFSPTSSISNPSSSMIPYAIRTSESRGRDLITSNYVDSISSSKTNSVLSSNLSGSVTSLKRGRANVTRSSDYASPTMLVFRFYESEMEELP